MMEQCVEKKNRTKESDASSPCNLLCDTVKNSVALAFVSLQRVLCPRNGVVVFFFLVFSSTFWRLAAQRQ